MPSHDGGSEHALLVCVVVVLVSHTHPLRFPHRFAKQAAKRDLFFLARQQQRAAAATGAAAASD